MKKSNFKKLLCSALALMLAVMLVVPYAASAAETSGAGIYYNDYSSEAENREAARKLYAEVASEGNVLLKNKDNALPLGKESLGISLFGLRSELTYFAGAGSAGGDPTDPTNVSLKEALEAVGYRVNPTLADFIAAESRTSTYISAGGGMFDGGTFTYKNTGADNLALEIPISDYPADIAESFASFNDVAILVFGRQGSEGADSYRGTADILDENGNVVQEGLKHYLELTDTEEELLEYVKSQNFGKIIVLINTGVQMELGELENDNAIDAILWIGMPGAVGMTGTAQILSGEVNPSGKTVDIYPADFKKDPTYQNFNDNEQTTGVYQYSNIYSFEEFDETKSYVVGDVVARTEESEGSSGITISTNYYEFTVDHTGPWDQSHVTRFSSMSISSVEYEEGIYVGYRYYETRAHEYTSDPDWYEENVVYPFGYGLSYTTFSWSIVDTPASGTIKAGDTVDITVRVTNTGDVAGKDVVQVYAEAPYTAGGIEKAYVVLVDYVKTDLLQPGESATYTLSFDVKWMASFDDVDKNGNGFMGYELEAGNYKIKLQSDSHNVKDNCVITRTVTQNIQYDGSTDALNYNGAGNANAEAVFSQDDKYNSTGNGMATMSRADMSTEVIASFPTAPTKEDHAIDVGNFIYDTEILLQWQATSDDVEAGEAWYDNYTTMYEENKNTWTQAAEGATDIGAIQFSEMIGLDKDDPKWDEFLNQLTWSELLSFTGGQSYNSVIVERLGIPEIQAADGPGCVYNWHDTGRKGTYLPNASMVSSTWNDELVYEYGIMIGNEAMWDDVNQWYSPAVDMHRTPFSGRSFEYYSEESLLAGRISGNIIKGCQEKGLICTLKHFGVNEQELDRSGLSTWATEQTLREVYLKAYAVAIEIGNPYSLMTAMNRIGSISCDNNYHMNVTLLRNEWGFEGYTMTDMSQSSIGSSTSNADVMPRSGVDCVLTTGGTVTAQGEWDAEANTVKINGEENVITWAAVRNSAKNQLYAIAQSSVMDNFVDLSTYVGKTINASVGTSFSETVAVADVDATNAATLIYQVSDGELPAGLELNELTGEISGTPEVCGTYRVKISAVADHYVTNTQTFIMVVDNGIMSLDAGEGVDATAATVGSAYSANVTVQGYDKILAQWHELVSGSLPAGMNLDPATGAISGTPTEAGTYTFCVKTNIDAVVRSGFGTTEASRAFTSEYTIVVTLANAQTNEPAGSDDRVDQTGNDNTNTPETPDNGIDMGIISLVVAVVALVVGVYAVVSKKKDTTKTK